MRCASSWMAAKKLITLFQVSRSKRSSIMSSLPGSFSIDTPSAEAVIDEINRGDIFSPQLHFIGQGSDLADDPAAAEEFFRDGFEQGCSSPPGGGSSPESEPDSKASRQSDRDSAKRRSGILRSHWIYDYVQPQLDAGERGQARQDGQVPAVPWRGNMFKRRS